MARIPSNGLSIRVRKNEAEPDSEIGDFFVDNLLIKKLRKKSLSHNYRNWNHPRDFLNLFKSSNLFNNTPHKKKVNIPG